MHCTVCHSQLPAQARFCPACGAPVLTTAGPAVSISQEIGTVGPGGAAVGAVLGGPGGHVHVGGQQHYADTVQGDKQVVHTADGAYVGGNVTTGGGKFVGRDDVTVVGDGNVVGDHSQATVIKRANQGATLAEFTRLLGELRGLLPQAGLDTETADVVDADVQAVQAQAARPKPNRAIIVSKLEGITKLLTAAAGAAAAGERLLPLAQKAVEWAGQLFR